MPINLFWYEADIVIYIQVSGTFTPQEAHRANTAVLKMLQGSQQPQIYFLFDFTQLETLPGINALKQLTFASRPNSGYGVAFGLKRVQNFVVSTVARFFGKKHDNMANLEQAVRQLGISIPALKNLTVKNLADLPPYPQE